MKVFTGLGMEGDANGELAEKATISIVTMVCHFTNTVCFPHFIKRKSEGQHGKVNRLISHN